MTFALAFELISFGSLALAGAVIIVFRYWWRRGKKLQEP
jgi:hypothetical protein